MNTENYSTGGNQDQGPKKKHGKGASRWAKVVCTGLVFGVVASAAFQTSNIVAGKVLGTTQSKTVIIIRIINPFLERLSVLFFFLFLLRFIFISFLSLHI